MSYKTRNGQILTGDLFIDCTGQRVNVKAPSEAGSSSSAGSITPSGSKEHSWPYGTNGLIAVDSHLMVSQSHSQRRVRTVQRSRQHVHSHGIQSSHLLFS